MPNVTMSLMLQALLAGCLLSQDAVKPLCNAENRGRSWSGREARTSCTQVEICSRAGRKYRWIAVTVPVSQLWKDPARKQSCDPMAPPPAKTEAPADREDWTGLDLQRFLSLFP